MNKETAIKAFSQLGVVMQTLGSNQEYPGTQIGITAEEYEDLQRVVNRQFQLNGWFTKEAVQSSLLALSGWLTEESLNKWLSNYSYAPQSKKVGIIMAGNIPLVGFHDLLCVVLSGNCAVCKMSSDDKTLLPALVKTVVQFEPQLAEFIQLSDGRIGTIEAVIATGSNNSMLHFEQYFGKYPHLFRKNRTSVAILNGEESQEELHQLGVDIFTYFGLGCRNVSHILLPKGYDLKTFFEGIFEHSAVINHFKYGNNYDYNKAVYLMNQLPLFDNNFVLLRETPELHSPLGMVHYHVYETQEDISNYIQEHKDEIQVVVGKNDMPFGQAQRPTLMDYADGVDTMNWLNTL